MSSLRPNGGYRTLRSFRTTTLIYDASVSFCRKFIDPRSRTVDQMIQAARSGRQNIAEGGRAGGTSSQTELRLVNVARSSLEELLLDFEDYLRQNAHDQWTLNHPNTITVRKIGKTLPNYSLNHRSDPTDPTDHKCPMHPADLAITIPREDYKLYATWLNNADPAVIANAVICLIHQANYMLDHQIAELEKQFVEEGGYSENLAAKRLEFRRNQSQSDRTDPSDPSDQKGAQRILNCPKCGSPMVLRTAHQGKHDGEQFWGCSHYPDCKGTRRLDC